MDVDTDDDSDDNEATTITKHNQQQAADENRLSDDSDHPMTDDDDEDDDDDDDDNTKAEAAATTTVAGNADWAKSLARILKQEKPKNKKSLVLSKARKTDDILKEKARAKSIGFEIDGATAEADDDAVVKEEKPDPAALDAEIAERKQRRAKALSLRIRPSLMDRERERAFKKIATKGVVQLFNAVRIQQKDLSHQLSEAGRLDHKRDAVLNNINKRKFLDVLMGGARAKSENVDNPVKDELKNEANDSDDDGGDYDDYDDAVYNDGLPKNSIWSVLKYASDLYISFWF